MPPNVYARDEVQIVAVIINNLDLFKLEIIIGKCSRTSLDIHYIEWPQCSVYRNQFVAVVFVTTFVQRFLITKTLAKLKKTLKIR